MADPTTSNARPRPLAVGAICDDDVVSLLGTLSAETASRFEGPVQAWPEDQLKDPVGHLLVAAAGLLGIPAPSFRTEARVDGVSCRPDIAVLSRALPIGHVELKRPGKAIRADQLKGHDRRQFDTLASLPNVLYANGQDWALYRRGELVTDFGLSSRPDRGFMPAPADAGLIDLLAEFLGWTPTAPTSSSALAIALAPATRYLRDTVAELLAAGNDILVGLRDDWTDALIDPVRTNSGEIDKQKTNTRFADSYEQTITFALLLARVHGVNPLTVHAAAQALRADTLLGSVLKVLTDEDVYDELDDAVGTLERFIGAVDPSRLSADLGRRHGHGRRDSWLYFYEDFLAAYDPELRNNVGAWYTPEPIVAAQVRWTADLLVTRFNKRNGFADPHVKVLDPAAGTGAYPLGVLAQAVTKVQSQLGVGAGAQAASQLAQSLHAFELMVGPYAVTQLRLTQSIQAAGGAIPKGGVYVYLTDTLSSPFGEDERAQRRIFTQWKPLAAESQRAREVKRDTAITVCLGNPPYDRANSAAGDSYIDGGWVAAGDEDHPALLEDFKRPVRAAGNGGKIGRSVNNAYVYFWRWAIWKVCERQAGPGIVSFITPSTFLTGEALGGMRQVMREQFDEVWVTDLGGDFRKSGGSDKEDENVFGIKLPVVIVVAVRHSAVANASCAVRYRRIEGSRVAKFAALDSIESLQPADDWVLISGTGMDDFVPRATWPQNWGLVTDVFPWQQIGCLTKRSWPIGETEAVLASRWEKLLDAPAAGRDNLLRTTRDRTSAKEVQSLHDTTMLPSLKTLRLGTAPERVVRYGWRSLDRHWILSDARLADRPSPALWQTRSEKQIYVMQLPDRVGARGPLLSAFSAPPDQHAFAGNSGRKDVLPLWRDAAGTKPNIRPGLLEHLSCEYGLDVTAEDVMAYTYAIAPQDLRGPREFSEHALVVAL